VQAAAGRSTHMDTFMPRIIRPMAPRTSPPPEQGRSIDRVAGAHQPAATAQPPTAAEAPQRSDCVGPERGGGALHNPGASTQAAGSQPASSAAEAAQPADARPPEMRVFYKLCNSAECVAPGHPSMRHPPEGKTLATDHRHWQLPEPGTAAHEVATRFLAAHVRGKRLDQAERAPGGLKRKRTRRLNSEGVNMNGGSPAFQACVGAEDEQTAGELSVQCVVILHSIMADRSSAAAMCRAVRQERGACMRADDRERRGCLIANRCSKTTH